MNNHTEEGSVHPAPEVAKDPVLLVVLPLPFLQIISGNKEDVSIPEEVDEYDDGVEEEEEENVWHAKKVPAISMAVTPLEAWL